MSKTVTCRRARDLPAHMIFRAAEALQFRANTCMEKGYDDEAREKDKAVAREMIARGNYLMRGPR